MSKESDQNSSINKNIPFPYYLSQILSPSLERTDHARILGRPVKFNLLRKEGGLQNAYYFVYKDNFVHGGLWGLLSGYSTQSFFKRSLILNPSEETPTIPRPLYYLKRSAVITARVMQRLCLAGLLFDFVEKQASDRYNASRTNTWTIFGALTVCSVTFRLCNRSRENVVYTSAILGGYLLGAKLPPALFDEARRRRSRE